jgi:guanylate kinase
MSSKSGKLIVIVAPSGSGKSTLIKRLKNDYPQLIESVSFTTRSMRAGEVHGESYFFISKEEFIAKRDKGDFLEWAEVHTNYYGTSKHFVEEQLANGRHLLFDLDVQGTDSFKKYFQERAHAIFIAPPSVDELKNRLRGRGTDSTGVINIRLENSKVELQRKDDFDYCVVNDDLDRAYTELRGIVASILESA